jgi:hypothetical protein
MSSYGEQAKGYLILDMGATKEPPLGGPRETPANENGARRARTADLLGAIQNPGIPAPFVISTA